ncbi:MAG: PhnD/SsuA/transferrin family substrate-binding protein, partial [Bacillota bacterium]|nr:PhnD/SsuA/transferrin family substrate-binding protein [Bacillota bacterium]
MKKSKLILVLLTLCAMMLFGACGNDSTAQNDTPAEKTDVTVATLKGPTGMGMVQLMENNSEVNHYTFTLATAPDDIVGEIVAGNIDIAAVPTNLGATLYQKTQGNVEIAAVNTLGVLYILEKGDTIQSIADLAGKKILSAGQGTTAEYVVNYLLEQNGLALGENVVIDYASEHSEVAAQAQA